ncbi:MAG TPA: DUF4197 domain-containing protein [Kiloniellales bacterium]
MESERERGGLVRRSRPVVMAFVALGLGLCPAAPAGAIDLLKSVEEAVGGLGGSSGGLSDQEIGDGLTEALRVGTERVVGQVSATDGYNLDPDIHIPLPGALKDVQKVLKKIGMSDLADDLELRLNRAAEAAAPEAKELFWQAISEMSFDDVQRIYNGPDDAATRYFQGKMTPPLSERMQPVVERSLADVGAIQSYDKMMKQYKSVPFVPDAKADLTSYVVEQAMDGIFHYVAKEEAAIRNNPAARTTELLQKVFGAS